jgi:hypothetical protein
MSRALDKERDELVVVMREIAGMLAYLVHELAQREPTVVHQTIHGDVGQLAAGDITNHEAGSRARVSASTQALNQFS